MRKIYLLLFLIGALTSGWSQTITDTFQIGVGTLDNYFYGPIYRSSATSSFDFSRYSYLYTPAEMASLGVPSTAEVLGIAWFKDDVDSTRGDAIFSIYAENTSMTMFPSGTTPWNTVIQNATLAYTDSMQQIPGGAGWVYFDFPTPVTYTGGAFQLSTDWDISAATTPSSGSFEWDYEDQTGLAIGDASSSQAGASDLGSSSYSNRRPNILMIIRYTPPQTDAAILSIDGPESGCIGANEMVSLTVRNGGLDTLTNLPVGYTLTTPGGMTSLPVVEIIPGPIMPGMSVSYMFNTPANFSTQGAYSVNAFVNILGDQDMSNNVDTAIVENQVQAVPYTENFDSWGRGVNSPYPGGWEDGGSQIPWQSEDGRTGSSNTGPANDHTLGTSSGIYLYTETSSSSASDTFKIVSPCIDLTGTSCPKLGFWYHMHGSDIGELHVDVSTDGGQTFILDVIAPIVGEQQGDEDSAWAQAIAPLVAYANQTIKVRFRAFQTPPNTSFGGDIAIDDVSVFAGSGEDIAVTNISTTGGVGCPGPSDSVTITVQNLGCNTITTANLLYAVTGAASTGPITVALPSSIAPGATLDVTFSTPANFSLAGGYQITGAATLTGDADLTNNNVSDSIFVAAVQTAPYSESFESWGASVTGPYPGGWTNGGGTSSWETEDGGTSSSNTGPSVDHTLGTSSGIYLYTETSSSGANDEFLIVSPCINLANLTCPKMSFWYHMHGADIGELHVDVSTDGGETFTLDVAQPLIGEQTADEDSAWQELVVPLTAFANQTVRVRFRAFQTPPNASFRGDIAIDDFSVFSGSGEDAELTSIITSEGGCGVTGDSVTIEVTNKGCNAISLLPVSYTVLGPGTPATTVAAIPGSIQPGEARLYTFAFPASYPTAGTYTLIARTNLANDSDNDNDSLVLTIETEDVPAPPVTIGDTVCIGDSAVLVASGVGRIFWYDSIAGGSLIGTGDLVVDSVTGSETFYASTALAVSGQVGASEPDSFGSFGGQYSFEAGLIFSAVNPFILDSVTVYPGDTGMVEIEVTDAIGNPITSTQVMVQPAAPGDPVRVALNLNIPAGTDMQIVGTNPGVVSLFRNSSSSGGVQTYPFTDATGSVTITNPTNLSSSFYYFFYDWAITTVGCFSPRVPAIATIPPAYIGLGLNVSDTTICGNDTLNISADVMDSDYGYSWSNGSMMPSIDVTGTPGGRDTTVYTGTVIYTPEACSVSASVQVVATDPIMITNATVNNVACFGDSTGNIDIDVMGGEGMLTYAWSNGSTMQDLMNLPAGSYTGVITDTFGCSISATVDITQPAAALGFTADAINNVDCFGDSTGGISITPTGGTAPYTFLWSNGATSEDLTNLPAGVYTGTITDANGCDVTSAAIDITQPDAPLSLALEGTGDADCPGDANGYIFIDVNGGTAPYTYSWTNGATTQDLNGIPAGTYIGTITDANGCELVSPAVTIATTDTTPTAAFMADTAVGAVVNFSNMSTDATTYSWDFGDGSQTASSFNATHTYTANGSYTVTLVAYNNCGTDTSQMTISIESVNIEEVLSSAIKVYPNPTDGQFRIDFSELFLKDVQIQLTDLAGKQIYRSELGTVSGEMSHEVNLNQDLPQGVYLLRIVTRDGSLNQRLMVR